MYSVSEGRCVRAEVRIPRGPGSSCHAGLRGWCWWVGGNLEGGIWVCVSGQRPQEGAEHSTREWLLSIHPAEVTFQMYIISSMQMRGLFNMNDWPLNSYYFMAHCHNYGVHLVLLLPPLPEMMGKEGTPLSAASFPFILPFPSLLSELQLCCVPVTVGRNLFPFPERKICQILLAFSCGLTPPPPG